MSEIVLLLAVLICPVVMGTAMFLMWREMRRGHSPRPAEDSQPPGTQAQSQPETEARRDEAHARGA